MQNKGKKNYKRKDINQNNSYKFNSKIDEWLKYKKDTIKISSYTTYCNIIETKIRPILGNIELSKLNINIINNYITNLQNNKQLSNNTIHDTINILKQIIDFHKINIKVYVPPKIQNEITVFSKNEIQLIKKRALTKDNRCIFGIVLSLYTGIRIGELCALKKENFDMKNLTFTICNTIIRVKNMDKCAKYKTKLVLTKPKSKKSIRVIPIPNILKNYVIFYLNQLHEYDFFLSGKSNPIEPRSFSNHYKRFLSYWGIKHKKFHTTRHTFATKADEKQISTKALSEILGHSNTNITQSLYIHPSLNYKRIYINNIYNQKN